MQTLILGLAILFWNSLGLHAQFEPGGPQSGSPWGTLAVVLAIVAIARRKPAVGGWLFYFLGLTFIRAVATIVNLFKQSDTYLPTAWHNVMLYLLFLNSTTPGYCFRIGAAIAVTQLVHTEKWIWVERLKTILLFDAAAALVAIVIDSFYFKANLLIAVQELAFASVLWGYLSRSSRVEHAFLTHDWGARGLFEEPPNIK
jgi:hypothetical protein